MEYGNWHLGIGDPTPLGWITVAGYVCASVLCLLCALRRRKAEAREESRNFWLWLALGAAMLALGLNKQLDLQSLFTELGRQLARSQGWYAERREVQRVFVGILALGGGIVLALFLWLGRNFFRRQLPAVAGLGFLFLFVLVRAASFHHVDVLLGAKWEGLKLNWILELSGIFCVGLGGLRGLLAHETEELPPREIPDL